MKKIMLFAAACVALAACNKTIDTTTEAGDATTFVKGQKFTLTVSAGQQTRVSSALNGDGATVDFKWEDGDKVKVTVGDKSATFDLSSGAGSNSATFTGTMPADGETFDVQYPNNGVEASALASQTYSTSEALPKDMMLFKAEDCQLLSRAFELKAQYAALRLNLWGDKTVGKIVVTNMSSTESTPTYTLNITGGQAIGSSSSEATPFFIVVPAGEFQFSAEVFDNNGTHIDKVMTKQTFEAGKIKNMPALRLAEGALPAAGYRYGSDVGDDGYYWSSTANNTNRAYCLDFFSNYVFPADFYDRYIGTLYARLLLPSNFLLRQTFFLCSESPPRRRAA